MVVVIFSGFRSGANRGWLRHTPTQTSDGLKVNIKVPSCPMYPPEFLHLLHSFA